MLDALVSILLGIAVGMTFKVIYILYKGNKK